MMLVRRKLRLRWWAFQRWYYLHRHGVRVALDGSMLPKLGHGKYVSVVRRGDFLDIKDERSGGLIRLIPYQPNHGVMVEFWPTPERSSWRTHCDFQRFKGIAMGAGEGGGDRPEREDETTATVTNRKD
jgi:hypothetical protein